MVWYNILFIFIFHLPNNFLLLLFTNNFFCCNFRMISFKSLTSIKVLHHMYIYYYLLHKFIRKKQKRCRIDTLRTKMLTARRTKQKKIKYQAIVFNFHRNLNEFLLFLQLFIKQYRKIYIIILIIYLFIFYS